jgi:hypothetical protein
MNLASSLSALSVINLLSLATLGAALFGAGCSDGSSTIQSTSSNAASTGPGATSDCSSRCRTKATACGAPSESCAQLCAGATEADVACVENATCEALAKSEGKCPAASMSPSAGAASSGGRPGEPCVNGQCETGECLTQYRPALCSKLCTKKTGDCPASLPVCKDPLNSGTGSCQKE